MRNKSTVQIDVAELAEWYLAKVSGFILDNFDLYKTHPTKTNAISLAINALYHRDPVQILNILNSFFPIDLYMGKDPDSKNPIQIEIMDGENHICSFVY